MKKLKLSKLTHRDFPYLIQRMRQRKEPIDAKGVDAITSFDYMGSAEFEWGALPDALKGMRKAKPVIKEIKTKHGTCWFFGQKDDYSGAR